MIHNVPKTMWGFPVEHGQTEGSAGEKLPRRGVALIIAILSVSIIMIFATNAIINSQVNTEMALAHRDSVKNEFLLKSGFNLGLFLVSTDFGIDLARYSGSFGPKVDPTDSADDMWAKLNSMPIGGDTAQLLSMVSESFGLNAINDDETLAILKSFDGNFLLNVQDEAAKINVNFCADGRCTEVMGMLGALFSCPAEKMFLEQKGLSGVELSYRIKDWIDRDSDASPESGLNNEEDAYRKKEPPYEPKNAPMDTPEELRLIEGWDDEIHRVFSPYISVFPYRKQTESQAKTKVNVNSASPELLRCLFPNSGKDCNESFLRTMDSRSKDGGVLASDKTALNGLLNDVLCNQVSSGTSGTGTEGEDRGSWLTTRSNVFRIGVSANVGSNSRRLISVIERVMPDPAKKLETSYRILYWKLL